MKDWNDLNAEECEERSKQLAIDYQATLQSYNQRPVMDQRRWFHDQYKAAGLKWPGPEPEEFSPRTWEEEKQNLKDVLFGRRAPRTTDERQYLEFMHGIQKEKGDKRWIICQKCSIRFTSTGFAGRYPTICNSCADEIDAKPGHAPQTHTDLF